MVTGSHPGISVIIPTYNQANFLREAIQSILDQTFTDWEAIVVNNYSEDNTIEVVESFKDPRIKLINFSNHGVIGASRNEGVRQAKADIIAFLDSDDTWTNIKLEKVLAFFRQHPGVELVCHDEWVLVGNRIKSVIKYGPSKDYYGLLFQKNCLSTSAVAMLRHNFLSLGGFSEDLRFAGVEDYDLWLRLARAGCTIAYLHEVLGTCRMHDQSFSAKIQQHCDNSLNLLSCHFENWQGKTFFIRYLMRKRRADTWRGGAKSCLNRRDHGQARRLLGLALKEDPLAWKTWVLSAMNLLRVRI
ncbi:MAG: glycosyltransferase [Proteobacteria bacterium]|nr:glycosyltransferase [Pseudomonadota bacterium]